MKKQAHSAAVNMAKKFADGKVFLVTLRPQKREVFTYPNGNVFVGRRAGRIIEVLQTPDDSSPGLFRVEWDEPGISPKIEDLAGDRISNLN